MITLQLLGGLALDQPDAPVAPIPRRRLLALLAVVAASAPQPIAREKLLALLWPESDETRARNSLRQSLFALRRDLHKDLFRSESTTGLQLDPAKIDVDLWRFQSAIASGALTDAVTAYRGPFLDGFHVPGSAVLSQWVDSQRELLHRQYIEALVALAKSAEREGRFDDAVVWRQRQAAADPFSSRVALSLLKALSAAGDRPGALRHAARHERLLRDELEIESDSVVTEFVSSLRSEAQLESGEIAPRPQISVPAPTSVTAPAHSAIRRHRGTSRGRLAAAGAAILLATLAANRWVPMAGPATDWPAVVTVASGARPVSGRDPANRLVSCSGPACPAGPLPQDAYVAAPNAAYAAPLSGSSYIAPVLDGTTAEPPGYKCCTTAQFESTFRLPPNAFQATITMSMLADNQAAVAINGVEFGRQRDSLSDANFSTGDRFTTTFAPDPSGTNHLRVKVWDGGGAMGVAYVATVTYRRSSDPRLTNGSVRVVSAR